jgi:hypothetical protein
MGDPPVNLAPDLRLITETSVVSNNPDKSTKAEQEYEEKIIRNLMLRQILKHRGGYAFGIFLLVVLWLVGIFLILVCQGFAWHGFHLDDSVLLAAIGSTTANIIGVLLIIVKFIFSDSPQAMKTRKK